MDMELQQHTHTATPPPVTTPPGYFSSELTGFSDPTHYHLQRLMGEDERRFGVPSQEEWPTTLTS